MRKPSAPSNMPHFQSRFHYLWLFMSESRLSTVYSAQKDVKEPGQKSGCTRFCTQNWTQVQMFLC